MQNNNEKMFGVFSLYGTKEWEKRFTLSKSDSDQKNKQLKTTYEVIDAEETPIKTEKKNFVQLKFNFEKELHHE